MYYMPISPIGMMDLIDDFDTAFILAHLWAHEKYRRFYTNRCWEIVIVDNGVYEGASVSWSTLHEIAREISAERLFVVAPEVMHRSQETILAVKDYLREYPVRDYEVMAVLQAETPVLLKEFVEELVDDVTAFAIPIWMYRKGWCRAGLCEWLMDEVEDAVNKYWHALGLDTLLELPDLRHLVDSFDTSMPFTAAVHGMSLETNLIVRGKRRVNLLAEEFPPHVVELARKNLETLMRWIE